MPPTTFPNLAIRASAGSGKTFQLSNRILEVLQAGCTPDRLLATTFTRKAAGEILERVLLRLATASTSEAEAQRLADELGQAGATVDGCQKLLTSLLGQIHRLRVATLDSFFAQLAGALALELDFPPGWRILDETHDATLRAEAVRRVLLENPSELVTMFRLLTKGEATRSVTQELQDLVANLYGTYLDSPKSAWEQLPRQTRLKNETIAETITGIRALSFGDSRCYKARDSDCAAAEVDDWPAFIKGGLTAKVLNGTKKFQKEDLSDECVRFYQTLLSHARAVLVGQLVDQTEATWQLLDRFHKHYDALKRARRGLRFDDVTRRLAQASWSEHLSAAAWRLDAHVDHLLLDEFQDTSLLQWQVVLPLAQHVVADRARRSLFCVGDVKQAIYGWRGGLAELFGSLETQLAGLETRPLHRSFRSSQPVIDTVNRVFEQLDRNQALADHCEAARAWAEGFELHTTAKGSLAGYCQLKVAAADSDGQESGWRFAAQEVARLAAQAPAATVGVLVRKNATVAELIHELHLLDCEASEEGGVPLTDSPAVAAVLSALEIADHPADTVARYHVARSPLGQVLEFTDFADSRAANRLSLVIRRRLINDGYGPTLFAWSQALEPACDARDANRLSQLVEMAYRFDPEANTRPRDFLNLVASERVPDPTSARVRVMTVHQAKGLEFDIVVLPELDGRLVGSPPTVVVDRPSPSEPPSFVSRYAGKEVRQLLPPEVQRVFERHTLREAREGLCVLYVALTRAVHALHMIVAPAKSEKSEAKFSCTFAGLLRSALAPDDKMEPGAVLYEHGNPNWFRQLDAAKPLHAAAYSRGEALETVKLKAVPRSRSFAQRTPSGMKGESIQAADVLRLDDSVFVTGQLVHYWFEQIEWLDESAPNQELLAQLAAQRGFRSEAIAAAWPRFAECLAGRMAAVLHRARYSSPKSGDVRLVVERERPFAFREDNAIIEGQIDRLVLSYQGSAITSAEVIDFKTDQVRSAAALKQAVETYRPQLQAYRRAVAHITGLKPAKIAATLLFVSTGDVVSV